MREGQRRENACSRALEPTPCQIPMYHLLRPLFNTQTETCQVHTWESGNYSQALSSEDIQVTSEPPGRSQGSMDLRGNVSIQNKMPMRSKMCPSVFKQRFTTVRQYLDAGQVGARAVS